MNELITVDVMKTIKGNNGICYFVDNIDLGFIDPPFNIENNVNNVIAHKIKIDTEKVYYTDIMTLEEYMEWNKQILFEMIRICKKVVVSIDSGREIKFLLLS